MEIDFVWLPIYFRGPMRLKVLLIRNLRGHHDPAYGWLLHMNVLAFKNNSIPELTFFGREAILTSKYGGQWENISREDFGKKSDYLNTTDPLHHERQPSPFIHATLDTHLPRRVCLFAVTLPAR